MKVSAALIVRNEETTLGRCLESIRDGVDEIVIVDTGSADSTVEVARHYTTRIFEFPWRKDFAAARQFAFDRATGDWVFWVDADDMVVGAEKIRPSLIGAGSQVDGFYWKYIVGSDQYGNSTCELWRERCIRNNGTFRWRGRVHEVMVPRSECTMLRHDGVTVFHHPELPRRNRDPRRNLDILLEEYQLNRFSPDPRLLFYMGNEYAELGELDSALESLLRYSHVSKWDEEKYLAFMKTAVLLRQLGRYDEALYAGFEAVKTRPDWPNAYFSVGETYYYLQDWAKVVQWMEAGQRFPRPQTLCVIHPLELSYSWIIHYTNALFHMKRLREALDWSKAALAICPHEDWHRSNLELFSNKLETVPER